MKMEQSPEHILIVDDQPYNLQVTGKILQDEGYLISLATEGPSALSLLDQQTPDLILLDVMMPEMDGFQVCRKIKRNEKLDSIPVIFLTARSETEDLVEGFEAGGVDFITKPFNNSELLIRVRNHLELAGSRKKIMEMNQTRDKLYSMIAHDLRSPFSSIIQLVHTLNGGFLDPQSEDFKKIIGDLEKTTHETSTLLENLLQWTNRQNQGISFDPKFNTLYPLMLEVVQLQKSNAGHKNITLEIDMDEDLQAFFDLVSIHTVFRNLISNAIKFTADHGSIRISAAKKEKGVEINIRDTGVGMSEELIRKILLKNEPVTSPGTKNEQGSGLGLQMVMEFVNKNKGKLSFESTPGKGTLCRVALPAE